MFITSLQLLLWTVVLLCVCVATATDFRDRIIPDEIVGIVSVCAILLILVSRPEALWISLIAAILLIFALGMLSRYNVLGGGDVKLICAASLLVPPADIPILLAMIVIAGGVLGCLYLAARYVLAKSAAQEPAPVTAGSINPPATLLESEKAKITAGEPMPYGFAILAGIVSYIISEPPQCFYVMF